MSNTVLATAVAAYITKNAILFKDMAEDKVKHLVGDQLENSVQYFESHPDTEKFFSTSNGMVFHTAQHAANHAQTLKDNIVLPIDRADIAVLMSEGKEEPKATDYKALTVAALKALCEEKQIAFEKKNPTKAEYIAALEEFDAKAAATEEVDHEVTQEDLDNNPDLIAQGVQVGDIIKIPVQKQKTEEA